MSHNYAFGLRYYEYALVYCIKFSRTLCGKEDHDQIANNDAHTMSLTQKDINSGNNLV